MKNKWKLIGLIFIILLGALILAAGLFFWGAGLGYVTTGQKFSIWLQAMLLLLGLLLTPVIITNNRKIWAKDKVKRESLNPAEKKPVKKVIAFPEFSEIKNQCQSRYGLFWRYKVRKCLVIGSSSDIETLFPNLQQAKWQLSGQTLMVYGGDVSSEVNIPWMKTLKKHFSRCLPFYHKPLDAIIWAVSKNYLDNTRQQQVLVEKAILQLRSRDKILRWSAPLYLVSGQTSEWSQEGRIEQSVGITFSSSKNSIVDSADLSLKQLATECCQRGIQQVKENSHYAYLLQLSQNLVKNDIDKIKRYLSSLISLRYAPNLRGLFFTPHQSSKPAEEQEFYDLNHFFMTPTWQSITDDAKTNVGRRLGFNWGAISCYVLFISMIMTGCAMLTSYFRNQSLIEDSIKLAKNADDSATKDYTSRLQIQYQLQQRLEQLLFRQQNGAPLSYRFGLNHDGKLLKKLWSSYYTTNLRNIVVPFKDIMTDYLELLTQLPPDDPHRDELVESAYDVLKVYLMMSRADKSDGEYLSQFATKRWNTPKDISDGNWQRLMPDLVRFWGQSLNLNPKWAQKEDVSLVKNARQILINKIGAQNAVNSIYKKMIQQASQNYADQSLNQLLDGFDNHLLFFSKEDLPGIYTRKAWENTIKQEINEVSKLRQEQIDWVLSDGDNSLPKSISSESLKKQLTELYFSEYGAAWLNFLNAIEWRQSDNVTDVIEQLTILADTRQSPLVALVNAVKYQSEVAYSEDGLSSNILRSAKELINNNKSSTGMSKKNNEATGPLTETFAPIVSLLRNDNANGLSLETYLSRITQVRLKLQNIANSAEPQTMMQELAKSVFKGTSVDLTETRDYGNLIAANLGKEWSGFSYNLFKKPLEQSWQVVLTPAAESFNDIWQNYVVSQWKKSFAGRYPFKNSENEASLPELARFIRADTGIIDKFIISELNGVLDKKGGMWVVNNVNAQGLNFSPKFLEALNLFNELSAEVLETGDVSLSFDLMPRTGASTAKTELIINKQKLEYFNQVPTWQRFNWPGDGYAPYSQLSWSSNNSGLRLYQYYNGDWAWIRLLESASIKPLDSSRYELIWEAKDGNKLRYVLRTQLGGGPLTLLKLRNFTLPQNVFE